MELTSFKVKAIIYPHGEYHLGSPVEVIDEGSFYRIVGSHIFDKHKIKSTVLDGDVLTIVMTEKR